MLSGESNGQGGDCGGPGMGRAWAGQTTSPLAVWSGWGKWKSRTAPVGLSSGANHCSVSVRTSTRLCAGLSQKRLIRHIFLNSFDFCGTSFSRERIDRPFPAKAGPTLIRHSMPDQSPPSGADHQRQHPGRSGRPLCRHGQSGISRNSTALPVGRRFRCHNP